MSLLIKALDNAERNKKAEQEKKPNDRNQAANPPLELEAIESKVASDSAETKPEINPDLSYTDKPNFTENSLSLEEEAGLTLSLDSKYARPKRSAFKASEKTAEKAVEKPGNKSPDKAASNRIDHNKALKDSSSETISANGVKAPVLPPVFQTIAAQNNEIHQKAAAKVFVANQAIRKSSSKSALLILGVAGALMIWLGLQGYSYIKAMLVPEVAVIKPAPIQPKEMAVVVADAAQTSIEAPTKEAVIDTTTAPTSGLDKSSVNSSSEQAKPSQTNISNNASTIPSKVIDDNETIVSSDAEINTYTAVKPSSKNRTKKMNKDDANVENGLGNEEGKHTIKLVRKPETSGVDPVLLSAYQAFTQGEDVLAQQQYRQILQRDKYNVDALLGMAAVAQRQGRNADAFGWYEKVLEIEPRNSTAQSALINAQANMDATGTESKIKSMLAQQPEAANLHASLGNLYASQNQWTAAQEAYFNASRYAPNNADYVFNLAISLEHLGKSNLALTQYQRALDLVNKSGAISPDKAQLEARIRVLQ